VGPKAGESSDNGAGGRGATAALLGLAAATLLVHLCTGGRYGFHRDELATLDDVRHLDWGYVAYPPVTPFFAWLSLALFGTSLTGFRFFAALACALSIFLTGLMARTLGGGRGAQLLAACAAIPFSFIAGSLMQYVAFDLAAWVALAFFLIRLCQSDDPRWWLAIGVTIGVGLLTKYTMIVGVGAIVIGVLTTRLRCYLRSKWLWFGVALSAAIVLPNAIWQWRHDFVSLDFLRQIHARDVAIGRAANFLPEQLLLTLLAFPLALAGIAFYVFANAGRRFRPLAWLYLAPLLFFAVAKGRAYYMAPTYPLLYAGGAVACQQWLVHRSRGWARLVGGLAWSAIILDIVVAGAFLLPLAPINSQWWTTVAKVQPEFCEEIGWPELADTVAEIRDALPASERGRLAILCGNYGEAGAINLYGPRHGLPPAISGVNSFWARGYGDPPPETVIALGFPREFLEKNFESCELAGHIRNRHGVANEETVSHPDIFVCRRLRRAWPEFWKHFRWYG
jgi:4-amino-4-deoxy-L-arabinose transferase-like glycosyltransferase